MKKIVLISLSLLLATVFSFAQKKGDASKPLIRYIVPYENRDVYLDELVKQCKTMGVSEVLLFTMLSTDFYGGIAFYEDEEFEKRMAHFRYCADRIRQEGLTLSVNAFSTLGHVVVKEEVVQHFGFERQLTKEGKPNPHPVLDPRSPKLREHIAKIYVAYASLKPNRLFVDDDFAVPLTGSFHEERVKEFARIVGCEATREAVSALVFNENPATAAKMQKIMEELVNRDLEEMAQVIEKAVHKVSPETKVGMMYASTIKNDVARIAKAMAGNHIPFVRPQLPIYREEIPVVNYSQIAWYASYWLGKLGNDFEYFPEIENYPYTPYSKSPETTYATIASVLGRGIASPAYNLEDFRAPGVIDYLANRKEQVKKVTELISVKTKPLGLGVWNMLNCSLELTGLPFKAVGEPETADVFVGRGMATLTDSQLEAIVKRGGIFDIDALRVMKDRGFLSEMGIEKLNQADRANLMTVDFNQKGLAVDGSWSIYYFLRNLPDISWPVDFKAKDQTVLHWIKDKAEQPSVPYSVKWKGPNGQHFGFINFAYDRWPIYAWLHTWMPGIMDELSNWVKGESIGVIMRNNPRVVVEMCETESGKILLTLINYNTGSSNDVKVSLSEKLGKMKWAEIDAKGVEKVCKSKKVASGYEIQSADAMPALGVKFFVGQ